MSREQDQKLVEAYERVAKGEPPKLDEAIEEGFANKVSGGKVPIGHFGFEYIPKDKSKLQFLINSMKKRDPLEIIKLKNSVVMKAYPRDHQSLISSLQKLQFDGEVIDYNYKEKGKTVYQKKSGIKEGLNEAIEDIDQETMGMLSHLGINDKIWGHYNNIIQFQSKTRVHKKDFNKLLKNRRIRWIEIDSMEIK